MSKYKIIIYKECRKLKLYLDNEIIATYQIGLGTSPKGKKTTDGDCKTPEGKYYICTKNPKSKYHLSLGLSYPNITDGKFALENNKITKKEYQQIEKAINKEKRPLWDTPLGGEIMIHGGGASDWTVGCIALDNADIANIWSKCSIGTHVIIKP